MAFGNLGWFQRKRKEKEEDHRLVMEELQGLKKLLRKQSVLIEEVRRGQEALAVKKHQAPEPLLELCDAVFYVHRAFQNPGLMSRQHAQVLSMVLNKAHRFAASLGLEMILDEGIPFDSRVHEAIANRSPGSHSLEVIELVQPGYLRDGKVVRPAKVIVGATGAQALTSEGATPP